MIEQSRIMVTGGSGFLGSHLCDRLVAAGHDVLCVDNFYTGRRRNVEGLLDSKRFELMRHDVTMPLYVEVDEIYNLACPASARSTISTTLCRRPRPSVHGAINMLGLAKRLKLPSIFQASTSEVYGDPAGASAGRSRYWGNVNPVGPRSCYDEGKRCAETLFFDYHRQHGLRDQGRAHFQHLRAADASRNDGRVVSNFIVQALKGQDITIYGDGAQTRSFCYVDDLIEGFIRLMATPDAVTGPVNLGNPGEFTMLELAQKVLALTGSGSKIVHMPLPQDDPRQRRPDITLAKSALDWTPKTPLDEGLTKTIAYFDGLLRED